MQPLWAIYNPLKAWTLFNLNENEVRLLLQSLTGNELRLVKVCLKNESAWQVLNPQTHTQFFDKNGLDSYFSSEGFPSHEQKTATSSGVVDTEFFIVKPVRNVQQRQHKRYDIEVPCSIVGFNKEFLTQTKDLSEGGLFFKETIPDWVAGYFLVVVNEQFQLMCSLVEDQKEKRRVQIVSEENDTNFLKFKEWVNSL